MAFTDIDFWVIAETKLLCHIGCSRLVGDQGIHVVIFQGSECLCAKPVVREENI